MTPDLLFQIWDRFDASDADEVFYETAEETIRLVRRGTGMPGETVPEPSGTEKKAKKAPLTGDTPREAPKQEEKGVLVKAPLVGTFYRAPAPGERPFVRIGQKVQKGETLGIIEAMKMMNEITAPCDGVVTAILVEDETLVEYDQGLMRIGEENV